MNRRSVLSWLGVVAAGAIAPFRARANAPERGGAQILSLESFRVARPDLLGALHAYLEGAYLPAVRQVRAGPKMVLEAIVAPHAPEVLVLSAFASFNELLEVRASVAAHTETRRARAGLDSGDAPVLERVQSQLMTTTGEPIRCIANAEQLRNGVIELRSFQAGAWQDALPAAASAAFARAGVHPIVSGASALGEHLPQFTCVILFESLAARQEAWAKLDADPAWMEIQRDSIAKCGSAVKVTAKAIYKLAPYSPLA